MRNTQRRNRGLELGVILLISEIFKLGFDSIPPVTLITVIGQILLYIGFLDVPWQKYDVCISGHKVWNKGDYQSLLLSSFEHADDMHLYYNMISFLVKGRTLEYKHGTMNFCLLLLFLCIATPVLYVCLAILSANSLGDKDAMKSCAIGFSGVIFALKFITTVEDNGYSYVAGFRVPVRYSAWVELIAIHFLVPNASFMGHLAGILAGFIYMKTPIGSVVDTIIYSVSGRRMRHEQTRYSGSQYSSSSSSWRGSNYGDNFYTTGDSYGSYGHQNFDGYDDYGYPRDSNFYNSRPSAPPHFYDSPGWRF